MFIKSTSSHHTHQYRCPRFTRPLSKITKAGTFVDPEVQTAKSSSQWQPIADGNDEGGDSDCGGDFADACFDNSDDDCVEAAAPQQRPQAVGLQLVEAPKMAQRLDIGFARKAKRVDVKALKENLWSNLAPDGKKSSSTTFTSIFTEYNHLCQTFLIFLKASCPRSLLLRMLSSQMFRCHIVSSACCTFATKRV